jgi:hypothetical protein
MAPLITGQLFAQSVSCMHFDTHCFEEPASSLLLLLFELELELDPEPELPELPLVGSVCDVLEPVPSPGIELFESLAQAAMSIAPAGTRARSTEPNSD